MIRRYLLISLVFALTEIILRTFVDEYKFHTASLFAELSPIIALSLFFSFLFGKNVGWNRYLMMLLFSFLGIVAAHVFLFFIWYWIIAPEYRNMTNDMERAFYWTLFDLAKDVVVMLLCYFFAYLLFALVKKR